MKLLLPLFIAIALTNCNWDDPDEYRGCINSSDYQEFECINRNDFRDADGNQTPLSQTIADCTVLASTEPACNIATLPFIASETTTPNPSQIMSRVIVSHAWMADNFALLLEDMPADMLKLFSSVTAIVIHNEIRPAFFWPNTGAIYIDPYYLWTTLAQYNTISTDPDYRIDYGSELQFVGLARYTLDGEYAFATGNTRTREQTLHALSALLFHELAHARDSFPASAVIAPVASQSPGQLATSLEPERVSTALQDTYPLQEDTLFDIADVLYRGVTPASFLLAIDALAMGMLLESEGANDDYAYSTSREDAAMLFEETMMQRHYGIDREIVYATPLNEQQDSCDDFTFDWSAINRFAEPAVLARATFVVNSLLPGHGHGPWLANPGADGVFTWCQPALRRSPILEPESIHFDFWH